MNKKARRAAGAAKKAAAKAAMANAKYASISRVDVWGGHPAIVRLADGLMVPCTHRAPFRGEPVIELAPNWLNDGDMDLAYMKPLESGRYGRMAGGLKAAVVDAAVIAAADAAFAVADAK